MLWESLKIWLFRKSHWSPNRGQLAGKTKFQHIELCKWHNYIYAINLVQSFILFSWKNCSYLERILIFKLSLTDSTSQRLSSSTIVHMFVIVFTDLQQEQKVRTHSFPLYCKRVIFFPIYFSEGNIFQFFFLLVRNLHSLLANLTIYWIFHNYTSKIHSYLNISVTLLAHFAAWPFWMNLL